MDQDNEQPDVPDRISVSYHLVEYAWGIIANAGGGDWTTQTDDWQKAAATWREQYHEYLDMFVHRSSEIET